MCNPLWRHLEGLLLLALLIPLADAAPAGLDDDASALLHSEVPPPPLSSPPLVPHPDAHSLPQVMMRQLVKSLDRVGKRSEAPAESYEVGRGLLHQVPSSSSSPPLLIPSSSSSPPLPPLPCPKPGQMSYQVHLLGALLKRERNFVSQKGLDILTARFHNIG